MAARHLAALARVYKLLLLVFALLSAFDIDPLQNLWENALSIFMQCELLFLLFLAWVLQSIVSIAAARGG